MIFQKLNKTSSAPYYKKLMKWLFIQMSPFIQKLTIVLFFLICYSFNAMAQSDQIVTKNKMQDDYYQFSEKAKIYQKRADSTLKVTQMLREELQEEIDTDKKNLLEKRILKSEQQHTEYLSNANIYYKKAARLKNDIDISNQENRIAETSVYSDAFYKLPPISSLLSTDEWTSLYKLEPPASTARKLLSDVSNLKNKKNQLAIASNTTQSPEDKEKLITQIENIDTEIAEKEKEAFKNLQEVYLGKYGVNKEVLNRIINQTVPGDQQTIQNYKTDAEVSYNKATDLYKKATNTSDKEAELKLFGESNTFALLAIETQKKAMGIYTGTLSENTIDNQNYEQKPSSSSESQDKILIGEYQAVSTQINKTEKPTDTLININQFRIITDTDSIKSDKHSISIDEPLPKGVIYKIQIGVYKNLQSKEFFKGIWPVSAETIPSSQNLRFLVGMFSLFSDALLAIDYVKKTGFKDAFIIAYYNKKKTSVKEARSHEKQTRSNINQQTIIPAPIQTEEDSVNSENETVFLTIQIGAFQEIIPKQRLKELYLYAENEEINYFQNKKGLYVYTIGIFFNFEKAVFFKNGLIEKGLSGAYVIALKGDKKITLDEAIPMLK